MKHNCVSVDPSEEEYVWYGCYGSNLCRKRFYKYIIGTVLTTWIIIYLSGSIFLIQMDHYYGENKFLFGLTFYFIQLILTIISPFQGGKFDDCDRTQTGSLDKNLPLEEQAIKISNCSLIFANNATSWGDSGIAFLTTDFSVNTNLNHANSDGFFNFEVEGSIFEYSTTMERPFIISKLYLITKQQFFDIVSQENSNIDCDYGKINNALIAAQQSRTKSTILYPPYLSYYGKIIHLGQAKANRSSSRSFPIFTFTSSYSDTLLLPQNLTNHHISQSDSNPQVDALSDKQHMASNGEHSQPLASMQKAPSRRYLKTVIIGLQESMPHWNKEQLRRYLEQAKGIGGPVWDQSKLANVIDEVWFY